VRVDGYRKLQRHLSINRIIIIIIIIMPTRSVCEHCDKLHQTDFKPTRRSNDHWCPCMACTIITFGWTRMVLELPQGKVCVHYPEFARVHRRDIPGSFFRMIQLAMHENSNCFVVRGSDLFKNLFHAMKRLDNVEVSITGYVNGVQRYGLFDPVDSTIDPDSKCGVFLPVFLEKCVKYFY
jgi:hypothetical protein